MLKKDVYLLGAPQSGVERSVLISNLAAVFKKDVPTIEKMLRRSRTLVKAGVDMAIAEKYKRAIEQAGGQCELIEHGAAPEVVVPAPVADDPLTIEPVIVERAAAPSHEPVTADEAVCYCTKCGAAIRGNLLKCPRCRTAVPQYTSKKKSTAGLLAFFLGGLGVHRFYLGQWWGIFYLVFWGTLIPSVVSLIEAIVFWVTPAARWNEKYGRVPKSSGTMVIAAVVGVFLFISITGILAAVALPAYQEYTTRSKLLVAMPKVMDARHKVESFYRQTRVFPEDPILINLPEKMDDPVIASIQLQEHGRLAVSYHLPGANNGKTIVWAPVVQGNDLVWDCKEGGSLPNQLRPTECRGGTVNDVSNTPAKESSSVALTQTLRSKDQNLSLKVPESWTEKDLLETAVLGVANPRDENYAVVLADAKEDFEQALSLDSYTKVIQQQLNTNLKNGTLLGSVETVTVAGLPARRFLYSGSVDGVNIGYVITLIDSDTHYYRLLAWTLQSRLQKNKQLLTDVSDSIEFSAVK